MGRREKSCVLTMVEVFQQVGRHTLHAPIFDMMHYSFIMLLPAKSKHSF